MVEFYEKVGFLCTNFLLYGQNVKSVYKPLFTPESVCITVADVNGNKIDLIIAKKTICSLHGYKLSNYVIKLMQENNL